jgi:hypothetical protein
VTYDRRKEMKLKLDEMSKIMILRMIDFNLFQVRKGLRTAISDEGGS